MEEDGFYLEDDEIQELVAFLEQKKDKAEFELSSDGDEFNPKLIDKVFSQIRLFISARIMRKWEDDGKSPSKVTIKISLDIT